jgi:3-oxoacyl-[acyl-carrier protein] reductase
LSSAAIPPNSPPLAGTVAIVTGAATGIGRGIAARLAVDGAAVVVNHLEDQAGEAEALVAGIRAAGGTATAVDADISRREQFAALFVRTRRSARSTSSSTTPPSPH